MQQEGELHEELINNEQRTIVLISSDDEEFHISENAASQIGWLKENAMGLCLRQIQ
jgi:hypothetical protein